MNTLDDIIEQERVRLFVEAGLSVPEYGGLYDCTLRNGQRRLLRYGFHRKNSPDNWRTPAPGTMPSLVWIGWRDHQNYRFVRFEEIIAIAPHYPTVF